MNRAQRRALAATRGKDVAQQVEQLPLQIHHSHDGEKVILQFTRTIPNLMLTEQQAEAMVASLQNTLAALREHKAKPPQ